MHAPDTNATIGNWTKQMNIYIYIVVDTEKAVKTILLPLINVKNLLNRNNRGIWVGV